MTYQDILKAQLNRRLEMNPRFSLRAFAQLISLSPSKLSEILNRKKGLSLARASEICDRLKITGSDRALFFLSVESQHSRLKERRQEAQEKLKQLLQQTPTPKNQTQQKCAWYYGAIEALAKVGVTDAEMIQSRLGLTRLQVENAKRFLKRRAKNWPDRTRIRIEESSIFRRIEAQSISAPEKLKVEAFFVSASPQEFQSLRNQIEELLLNFQSKATEPEFIFINLNTTEL